MHKSRWPKICFFMWLSLIYNPVLLAREMGVWKDYVNRACKFEMFYLFICIVYFYYFFYFLCCRPFIVILLQWRKDVTKMDWDVLAVVIAYSVAAVECAEYKYNRCNWLHSVYCGEWIDFRQQKVHSLHQYAQNLWCTRLRARFNKSIGNDFNLGCAELLASWWEMCVVMCDFIDECL